MCIYAHINTYMYTCGGGRELLLESIRTVPTECFNNNAQYKTILTRMQIPWKKGSLVYSSTGPYPPKNVFASIIRVLRMIPDTTSSGFPLPKWNHLKWKSKILGEAQSALQDNEVQAQMGSEVSSETPSLEAQYLILLFFFNHCISETHSIGMIHFWIWLIRKISAWQAHNWNSTYNDGMCPN